MQESWKDIPGYGGKYQADREGRIRRRYRSGKTRLMTPYLKKKMSGSKRYLVKLTKEGRAKEEIVLQLVARTFLGPVPEGCVPFHKNGCQADNYVNNIAYVDKRELGKVTGGMARRRPVVKINNRGEITEAYSSAREAAKKNFMSHQTVIDRCNGRCKNIFAPDGHIYVWDDKESGLKKVMEKLEQMGDSQAGGKGDRIHE